MPSVFFLRYIFIPVWHSSARTTCGSWVSGKKRGRKKKTESLPVFDQDPLWQLEGEHIHTSVSPYYHNATLRQARTLFQGWKIHMEGYATVMGPLIKIPGT